MSAKMLGAMWWIDRWRRSSAYTDMTAEEQGCYRNLLDEVWLRPDHTIPDDRRILAKVSGDPEAWARCGDKVLLWMERTAGGWTHPTALEVIGQSRRRSEKQAAYRSRAGNAVGNDSGNTGGNAEDNKPGSPDLGLRTSDLGSRTQDLGQNKKPLPADDRWREILPPEFSSDGRFSKAFDAFLVERRKKTKRGYEENSLRIMGGRFQEWGLSVATAQVERSIGYQGVIEPNGKGGQPAKSQPVFRADAAPKDDPNVKRVLLAD